MRRGWTAVLTGHAKSERGRQTPTGVLHRFLGRCRVLAESKQRRKLAGPAQQRQQYRQDMRLPVRAHAGERGIGQRVHGAIDDDAAGDERQLMLRRQTREMVRLHIHGSRPGPCEQCGFVRGGDDRMGRGEQRASVRIGKRACQTI